MTMQPLYLRLGTPSATEVLSRVREGRKKALASVEIRFVVSCETGGELRQIVFDRQPTAADIVEELGENAVVVGIEARRMPARPRPLILDPEWRAE